MASQERGRTYLAVLPSEETGEQLSNLARRHGVDLAVPHVTVKAPPGLGGGAPWRPVAEEALARVPPFELRLGPPDWFAGRVLVLTVEAPQIRDLHLALVSALDEIGVTMTDTEGAGYQPHLTLGIARRVESLPRLRDLADAARRLQLAPTPVDAVWAMHRDDPLEPYRRWFAMPLA